MNTSSRGKKTREAHPTSDESPSWIAGPSEPQSATEHQAALDATVFRAARDPYELVLELDAGQLRLRPERPEA